MNPTLRRPARLLDILLVVAFAAAILFAPARASAAPRAAELSAATDKASADLTTATARLAAIDADIAAARSRLAAVESRLPSNTRQEAGAVAAAMGSVFSPALRGRAEGIAAAERSRGELKDRLERLGKERAKLAQDVAQARLRRDQAAALLADAARAEADRAHAAQVAAFGMFPVAGPNYYIDSWGFSRSGGRRHKGVDIMADRGTPVVAVRDGWAEPGSNGLGGQTVWVTGDDGKRYYYAHLDTIVVASGRVVTGQVLGTVGDTGDARGTPTHLHFEIHQPNAVDPFPYVEQMVRP